MLPGEQDRSPRLDPELAYCGLHFNFIYICLRCCKKYLRVWAHIIVTEPGSGARGRFEFEHLGHFYVMELLKLESPSTKTATPPPRPQSSPNLVFSLIILALKMSV